MFTWEAGAPQQRHGKRRPESQVGRRCYPDQAGPGARSHAAGNRTDFAASQVCHAVSAAMQLYRHGASGWRRKSGGRAGPGARFSGRAMERRQYIERNQTALRQDIALALMPLCRPGEGNQGGRPGRKAAAASGPALSRRPRRSPRTAERFGRPNLAPSLETPATAKPRWPVAEFSGTSGRGAWRGGAEC